MNTYNELYLHITDDVYEEEDDEEVVADIENDIDMELTGWYFRNNETNQFIICRI
jgi:hypothetical protein